MNPKRERDRREEHQQTIYGLRPVLEAIRAGRRRVETVWLLGDSPESALEEIARAAESAGVPVVQGDRAGLTSIAGSPDHQGVAARVGPLPMVDLEDLAGRKPPLGEAEDSGKTILILDQIMDPRNFGALCRSALALGCQGVVFPKNRSAGPTPAAAKAAAGALERLPLARVTNLASALDRLKELGYWVVGLADDAELTPEDIWCDGPLALVVGSEGEGIRRLVREKCDQTMKLATWAEFPVLNASVAGGIALYEVNKRRKSGGGRPARLEKAPGAR